MMSVLHVETVQDFFLPSLELFMHVLVYASAAVPFFLMYYFLALVSNRLSKLESM